MLWCIFGMCNIVIDSCGNNLSHETTLFIKMKKIIMYRYNIKMNDFDRLLAEKRLLEEQLEKERREKEILLEEKKQIDEVNRLLVLEKRARAEKQKQYRQTFYQKNKEDIVSDLNNLYENSEEFKRKKKSYYENNREYFNSEEYKLKRKVYYDKIKNSEEFINKRKEYYQKNKEKKKLQNE